MSDAKINYNHCRTIMGNAIFPFALVTTMVFLMSLLCTYHRHSELLSKLDGLEGFEMSPLPTKYPPHPADEILKFI